MLISTEKIIDLIKNQLTKDNSFELKSTGNPLEIWSKEVRLALYIRRITSAYFKSRPDVTRVQMHDSNSINILERKKIPVIVIGYCPRTESVVIWPPGGITSRFNRRKNVSLYSRLSFQQEASQSLGIKSFTLANGDVIIGTHISAIKDAINFLLPQFQGNKNLLKTHTSSSSEPSHGNELSNSEALAQILEDNPQFTFADAVDQLRSNRKTI